MCDKQPGLEWTKKCTIYELIRISMDWLPQCSVLYSLWCFDHRSTSWLISFAFIRFAKRSRVTKYLINILFIVFKQIRNLSVVRHLRHVRSFTLRGLYLNLIYIYLLLFTPSYGNFHNRMYIDILLKLISTVLWLFNELEQNGGFCI